MSNCDVTHYNSIALLKTKFSHIPNKAIEIETWNTEYEAMKLYIKGKCYKSRLAKKTEESRLFCSDMV